MEKKLHQKQMELNDEKKRFIIESLNKAEKKIIIFDEYSFPTVFQWNFDGSYEEKNAYAIALFDGQIAILSYDDFEDDDNCTEPLESPNWHTLYGSGTYLLTQTLESICDYLEFENEIPLF